MPLIMSLNHYVELFALLIALIFYKDLLRHSAFIYFIPFLAITFIVEFAAIDKDRPSKNIMYNFFSVCEFFFYSFLFYKNLHFPKLKRIVLLFFPCFICIFIINNCVCFNLFTFYSLFKPY